MLGGIKIMKSRLIIVGGFLGAGKTSLLWEAATRIDEAGKKVGLITNDQASELVDTSLLETTGDVVKEVSGSCFCCNFNGFVDAIESIIDTNGSGYILAEPVGSCTDLSATIMQPLKEEFSDLVELAPLTVLADPYRLEEILEDHSSSAAYILFKQFEEADIILINKTDLISEDQLKKLVKKVNNTWKAKVLCASVYDKKGIDEWLDYLYSDEALLKVGDRIVDVDYDIYAEGEAAFGWLNAKFEIEGDLNFESVIDELLSGLSDRFIREHIDVGHVKFLLTTEKESFIANITGNIQNISYRVIDKTSDKVELIINARAETSPDILEKTVREEVSKVLGSVKHKVTGMNCLIPGRPNPTHRYTSVV